MCSSDLHYVENFVMANWRGLHRVKGEDRAEVSDGHDSHSMNRKDYDASGIQPPWGKLEEIDPAGGLPQPQRTLRRPR